MCAMTVCRQDIPLTQEYLTHFYRLMHIGLTGTDQVSFKVANPVKVCIEVMTVFGWCTVRRDFQT